MLRARQALRARPSAGTSSRSSSRAGCGRRAGARPRRAEAAPRHAPLRASSRDAEGRRSATSRTCSQADASSRDARELVEKCLNVPELRAARGAWCSRGLRRSAERARELVRVLEVRLEFATDAVERRELLRRVAELRDERLTDDPRRVRGVRAPRAARPARQRTRASGCSRLPSASASTSAPRGARRRRPRRPTRRSRAPRSSATSRSIYEEYLERRRARRGRLPARARRSTRRTPRSRCRRRARSSASTRPRARTRSSQILRIEVKLEEDAETRRDPARAPRRALRDDARRPRGAIEAWKARLEDDPATRRRSPRSIGSTSARASSARSSRCSARASGRADAAARKTFMLRTAAILADKLSDVPEAILAYRAVVDDFGAEPRDARRARAPLREGRVAGRTSRRRSRRSSRSPRTQPKRLGFFARLGDVRLDEAQATCPARSTRYRQALAIDPRHAASAATRSRGSSPTTDARREAAAILRPLYEAEGDQMRLLRVLDIEAEYADTIELKLATSRAAASVAEGPLGDPQRAFGYASRALREAAGEPDFRQWLERAERLAETTGRWAELVELLQRHRARHPRRRSPARRHAANRRDLARSCRTPRRRAATT